MAWKLKRSKSTDVSAENESDSASDASTSKETAATEVSAPSERDFGVDSDAENRTVMLLNTSEILNDGDASSEQNDATEIDSVQPVQNAKEWELDPFAPYKPQAAGASEEDDDYRGFTSLASQSGIDIDTPVGHLTVHMGQFNATYEIAKRELTIGRPDAQIDVLPDISIEWDDHKEEGDFVEDTGSTNGTMVNSHKIAPNSPELLSNGDVIEIGEKTQIIYTV
jgi:hypothetical protein